MTRQTSAIYQWSYWGAIQSDSGGFLNSDHTIDFPALIALYYFTDFPWQADCQAQTAFIHCLLMIAKLSLYFLQIFYWSNKDPRNPFITILNQCLDVLLIIEMIHLFSSHILVITLFHAAIRSAATIKSRTRPCLQCIIILYHCLHTIIRNHLKCCNNWVWTVNKEALFATCWLTIHRRLWPTFGSGD